MSINKLIFFSSFIFLISSCDEKTLQNINVSGESIRDRIICPFGYSRENYDKSSWQYFLQNLNLKPNGSKILDFTGEPIFNQKGHVGIIDYDIGKKDLQQCADAIIRLRAEYLYKQQEYNDIEFKFTSGHNYRWIDYAKGIRPSIDGNKVTFKQNAKTDSSYSSFRNYLDIIFIYAGTISLNRDLEKIPRNNNFEIGDIIIKAGSPGHAVLVVDRVRDNQGNYLYLLAEGYTPAQSIHILKSGKSNISPWFKIDKQGSISSKRFYFSNPNIRRFN
jgi:hypothetical protein